jgi:hypothetical protein
MKHPSPLTLPFAIGYCLVAVLAGIAFMLILMAHREPAQMPPAPNPAIPDLKLAAEALEELKRVSADHDVLTFEGLPLADKTVTFLEGWPDAEHPIPDRIEDWRFVVQWHDGKVWVAKWEVKP